MSRCYIVLKKTNDQNNSLVPYRVFYTEESAQRQIYNFTRRELRADYGAPSRIQMRYKEKQDRHKRVYGNRIPYTVINFCHDCEWDPNVLGVTYVDAEYMEQQRVKEELLPIDHTLSVDMSWIKSDDIVLKDVWQL